MCVDDMHIQIEHKILLMWVKHITCVSKHVTYASKRVKQLFVNNYRISGVILENKLAV